MRGSEASEQKLLAVTLATKFNLPQPTLFEHPDEVVHDVAKRLDELIIFHEAEVFFPYAIRLLKTEGHQWAPLQSALDRLKNLRFASGTES